MKNKIIIFTLVIALAIPQIVSAVWWNPLSWFTQQKETYQQPKINSVTTSATSTVVEQTDKQTKSEPKPEIVTNTIIKTIQVDNPTLLAQIEQSKALNTFLQSKYDGLVNQLNECKSQTSAQTTTPSQTDTKNIKLVDIDTKILTLINTLKNNTAPFTNSVPSYADGKLVNPNLPIPVDTNIVDQINNYIQAYKIVDSNSPIKSIGTGLTNVNIFGVLDKLISDMNLYIKYR
ncbi:MAG: hypothetical protein EXS69_00295 [Candidatus Zambryskibacteria bacterium]|nr:hypothetical protein [Candidatus Zambryskibacteria bacterium]